MRHRPTWVTTLKSIFTHGRCPYVINRTIREQACYWTITYRYAVKYWVYAEQNEWIITEQMWEQPSWTIWRTCHCKERSRRKPTSMWQYKQLGKIWQITFNMKLEEIAGRPLPINLALCVPCIILQRVNDQRNAQFLWSIFIPRFLSALHVSNESSSSSSGARYNILYYTVWYNRAIRRV